MKPNHLILSAIIAFVLFGVGVSGASEPKDFSSTIEVYKENSQVRPFFESAYGYAVFPAIGKGGFGIGGAYGSGQVYKQGEPTGTAKLVKLSIGWQAGGQAYSQMVFFQDKRAYDEFTSGEFSFDAQASAVAITAGAQAKAGTSGSSASATAGPRTGKQATTGYHKGMVVFVHAIGGFMFEAAVAGQKYSFEAF